MYSLIKLMYSRTQLNRINWVGEPSGCASNPYNWIFSVKKAILVFEVGGWGDESSTDSCFRLHIYLHKTKHK